VAESTPPRPATDPRVGAAVAIALAVAIVAIGALRLLRDPSFWLDEAALALNVRDRPIGALFAPLEPAQNAPRLFLVAASVLRAVFGYETLVLRALPFAAFVAATFLWLHLLWRRFARRPWILVLAVFLVGVPATWISAGVLFKQYSLDLALALLPFALPDRLYTETLVEGRRRWRGVLLAAPILLSYTYALALLGRGAGWALWRLRTRGAALDLRALALLVAAGLAAAALLAWTDLRHVSGRPDALWRTCIPGQDWSRLPDQLRLLGLGWYRGQPLFSFDLRVPEPVRWAIGLATLLGIGVVIGRLARAPRADAWGSRSLGSLGVVLALVLAAPLIGYPICAGRLTLFAWPSLLLLALEGVDALHALGRRSLPALAVPPLLVAVLATSLVPTVAQQLAQQLREPLPGDLRPALARLERHAGWPVLVTPCSVLEVRALPEGLPSRDVRELRFIDLPVDDHVPFGRKAFVIDGGKRLCRRIAGRLRRLAHRWEPLAGSPTVFEVYFPKRPERRVPVPAAPGTAGRPGDPPPAGKRAERGAFPEPTP